MITKFCKNCVNSSNRPGLTFNVDDICDACQNSVAKNKIDWKSREEELVKLLDQHRSKNGDHDVLVPTSGGKDSTYVAHQLKYVYGMNPLGVSWAPSMYTEIGYNTDSVSLSYSIIAVGLSITTTSTEPSIILEVLLESEK